MCILLQDFRSKSHTASHILSQHYHSSGGQEEQDFVEHLGNPRFRRVFFSFTANLIELRKTSRCQVPRCWCNQDEYKCHPPFLHCPHPKRQWPDPTDRTQNHNGLPHFSLPPSVQISARANVTIPLREKETLQAQLNRPAIIVTLVLPGRVQHHVNMFACPSPRS
jgi:hypothetical protein